MPATNAVLHDPRYRADGIFCEAPKKLDPAVVAREESEKREHASQSRWNTDDYHWEERDVLEFARTEVAKALEGAVLWRDANGGELAVSSATLDGDAASNVRKGRRILTYALTLAVTFRGTRGGARLDATITTREFCHDDDAAAAAPALVTTPLDSDEGCDVARAMKAHEMFAKVLKKKGLPLVDGAVAALRARLLEAKGDAASEAPKARA